ncbi:peptidylprolyl isomerase [Pusillimonas sp. T2]|nr:MULTISPECIES: peptidylprolyl isomerase [unclassified Pusillimonas]OXR49144.1 peptidylprolyl isomerase [Pusillimonas sp. T2]ROT46023.1 peptidylprolyl isomerase [Pusillimonas sp. NJUB218]
MSFFITRIFRSHLLRRHALGLACAALVALPAISAGPAIASSTSSQGSSMSANPKVKMQTNFGDMIIELNAEKAPKTVENFVAYVNDGFFDGTIFHRVINNFMVQGGGFEAGMKQKETRDPIENEANNGLRNDRYTLAMARTSDPHSATAQFFINVADNDFLNHTAPTSNGWGYAVFGKVVEGTDVVDKIKVVKTGSKGFHQDVPTEDVIIEKATVVE